MVLTPQLRQRIEMLQMTALELNELIETEMATNPLLEEVQPGDEIEEISSNILDQNSDSAEVDTFAETLMAMAPIVRTLSLKGRPTIQDRLRVQN